LSRKTEDSRGSLRSEGSNYTSAGTRLPSTSAADRRRATRQHLLRQKSGGSSQQDQQTNSDGGAKHARNSRARAATVRERRRSRRSRDVIASEGSHRSSSPELIDTIPDINPKTKHYSPRDRFQDQVRRTIANTLVYSFMGTILLSFVLALYFSGNKDAWPNVKDLIQLLITAETGLMGAAVGFYFGASTQKDHD
jgi:hypothetical protein